MIMQIFSALTHCFSVRYVQREVLLCFYAPVTPIHPTKHNALQFLSHIDSGKLAHTSHAATLFTFHLPPIIKHIVCPLTFREIPKRTLDLLFCVVMIFESARTKLVTSIKTQLHPASDGGAAIATRHSVFAEDE